MDRQKRCILIGAGDLNLGSLTDYDEESDTVIAVDGGLMYCGLLNIEPDIIIGDFDSLDEPTGKALRIIESTYPDKVMRLKPKKDDTDMMIALKWGLARGFTLFHIYAGLGGRFDHTLANIQCLLYLRRQNADGFLFDEDGLVMVAENESRRFQPTMEGMLSLFSLEAKSVVSIENMKYPLLRFTVTNDCPIGISNEFLPGKSGEITVHSGAVVLMLKW